MPYLINSIRTLSYWRYAFLSKNAVLTFFAVVGALWTLMEILDFLNIYAKDQYSRRFIFVLLAVALIVVIVTRRPLSRFRYKLPRRDLSIEVRIGDVLDCPGERIISSNTTFDTDVASGLISQNSVQGQATVKYFQGNIVDLNRQLDDALAHEAFDLVDGKPGKPKRYPIGTVARVRAHGQNLYFIAMAHINEHGTAVSDIKMIEQSLEKLWVYMATRGELGDIIIPLVGTGRGRVEIPRKKLVEKIAQSFLDASRKSVFSNKLVIVIHPSDAANFDINLFEVRDLLLNGLHV